MQLADYVIPSAPLEHAHPERAHGDAQLPGRRLTAKCFREAGLAAPAPTPDIVRWWDSFAMHSRGRKADILLEIGRKGEQLSIRYEARRTARHRSGRQSKATCPATTSSRSFSARTPPRCWLRSRERRRTSRKVRSTCRETNGTWLVPLDRTAFHIWAKLDSENPVLAVSCSYRGGIACPARCWRRGLARSPIPYPPLLQSSHKIWQAD
jgi:hypothetical protein